MAPTQAGFKIFSVRRNTFGHYPFIKEAPETGGDTGASSCVRRVPVMAGTPIT
jgi:hypothetical protein